MKTMKAKKAAIKTMKAKKAKSVSANFILMKRNCDLKRYEMMAEKTGDTFVLEMTEQTLGSIPGPKQSTKPKGMAYPVFTLHVRWYATRNPEIAWCQGLIVGGHFSKWLKPAQMAIIRKKF